MFEAGHQIIGIVGFVLVAALVVLVVMNADKVATVVGAGSNALLSESALLTGSGYNTANYGAAKG